MTRTFPATHASHGLAAGRDPVVRHGGRARAMALLGASVLALASCTSDFDMRGRMGSDLDTAQAARTAAASRPEPDGRGVISYPTYQVAVARRGDTVGSVAARVGVNAEDLARYNALQANMPLNQGEILALPNRVAEPVAPMGGGMAGGPVDITTLASGAIDRAESTGVPASGTVRTASAAPVPVAPPPPPAGAEPVRHKVARGETAYTIARAYNVSVRSLADWNGLSGDMTVREGQYLLIPVSAGAAPTPASAVDTAAPGEGSATPVPPSASKPLPAEQTAAASAPVATPPAPDMGAQKTAASSARFSMPVDGKIIRPYEKKKNDGIDIAAAAGTGVRAADAGTVAAITKDTDQVPILVIRHANNMLTVYANIDGITVAKGDTVKRGQTVAKVRAGTPAFVHFEVRNGFDSVDPMPYLQ